MRPSNIELWNKTYHFVISEDLAGILRRSRHQPLSFQTDLAILYIRQAIEELCMGRLLNAFLNAPRDDFAES